MRRRLGVGDPRGRRRLILNAAGIGLLFVSGVLAASAILSPFTIRSRRWSEIVLNLAIAFFGVLIAVLLMNAGRREALILEAFEWLGDLDNLLAGLSAPLTAEKLYPTCEKLASLFPGNLGWVVLVRAPGLLIRGEVKRRRYLPIVSQQLVGKWNISWAENFLKDIMEAEKPPGKAGLLTSVSDEDGGARPMTCWISQDRAGDITAGVAITQKTGRWRRDAMTLQALSTGLDMVVQRIGSILVEVIERREGLGIENLGLIMRVLAHEINNDLQGALNSVDASSMAGGSLNEDAATKLRSLLARASHWSHLMREAPFLVDNVLPFERGIVSLPGCLRDTLDEVRQAWPDLGFIVEMPEAGDDILVTADPHLRSVFRNLLHNAASFTPEDGSVQVRVRTEGEYARVLVEDEGPGVDPADVDLIFAPLESLREGRRAGVRAEYGMGVGLTISRAIARAYGGELRCHSNVGGAGGVFEVLLPLEKADASKAEGGEDDG